MAKAAGASGVGVRWSRHAPDVLLNAGAERILDSIEQLLDTNWMALFSNAPHSADRKIMTITNDLTYVIREKLD